MNKSSFVHNIKPEVHYYQIVDILHLIGDEMLKLTDVS
jgi:hypothetical protein